MFVNVYAFASYHGAFKSRVRTVARLLEHKYRGEGRVVGAHPLCRTPARAYYVESVGERGVW